MPKSYASYGSMYKCDAYVNNQWFISSRGLQNTQSVIIIGSNTKAWLISQN